MLTSPLLLFSFWFHIHVFLCFCVVSLCCFVANDTKWNNQFRLQNCYRGRKARSRTFPAHSQEDQWQGTCSFRQGKGQGDQTVRASANIVAGGQKWNNFNPTRLTNHPSWWYSASEKHVVSTKSIIYYACWDNLCPVKFYTEFKVAFFFKEKKKKIHY